MSDEARIEAFLADPASWPEAPERVEVVDTHLSTVYLVGDSAYKRKKPLQFIGHDYRTLSARFESCLREVRVNRRLAPDVYLGHVPVVQRPDGTLQIGGMGQPVEWLVHMRRIPIDRTLECGLRAGWASREQVSEVGEVLARFYADLPRLQVSPEQRTGELKSANQVHQEALSRVGLDGSAVTAPVARFLESHAELVGSRSAWLVAGHGDLRPEHVVLIDPPVFIDALDMEGVEVDPVDELAYLAFECEILGAPWVRDLLLGPWTRQSGDPFPAVLVDFYQALRAGLRAWLYAVRLWELRDNAPPSERQRWTGRARTYLEAGARHAAAL